MARTLTLLAGGAAALGVFAATGCYSNYPAIDGARPLNDVNILPSRGATVDAVRWTISRYAGGQTVMVNLPSALKLTNARGIIASIGEGAVGVTRENEGRFPVFHVARVWIRNNRATVDILVPSGFVPGVTAEPWRTITVRLEGGPSKYTVRDVQVWETAIREVPELHYLEEADTTPAPARESFGEIE
ncbi:MAG: hypothetical protein HRU70_06475 [Phycisphaeraceae bacterium]|nr:MAG: hypothetical protein HRU70_06475 [Phycisphaeraceae bacterium]